MFKKKYMSVKSGQLHIMLQEEISSKINTKEWKKYLGNVAHKEFFSMHNGL